MRDINDLRLLSAPRTWKMFRIGMVAISLASMAACIHYGVPWLMTAFIGLFFILPLLGSKKIIETIQMAQESYDGGHSHGGTAKWIKDDSSDSTRWSADIDLGTQGQWIMEIGSERPVDRDKEDLPAVVTVWIHPRSGEPRLLKSSKGIFYAKSVTARPS